MICHSDAGNGPISASRALADALYQIRKNPVEVSIIDVLHETTSLGFASVRLYNYLLTRSLRWNALALRLFYRSNAIKSGSLLNFSVGKLCKILHDQNPDIVVFTNPWIIGYVMAAIKKMPPNVRPIAVSLVIDIGYELLPPSWYHPDIDSYIVPTLEAKRQLIQFGAFADDIKVIGMPVHPSILATRPTRLDEKSKTLNYRSIIKPSKILVMAGRAGTKNTFQIIEGLLGLDIQLDITVLCGMNAILKKKIEHHVSRIHSKSDIRIRVEGFVENIEPYMKEAHLIISKPGALTVSEAIVLGVPVILDCDPVMMAQEVGNASFVSANGVGLIARKTKDIPELVLRFFKDEGLRLRLLENLQNIENLGRTMDIAESILELSNSLSHPTLKRAHDAG